MRLTVNLDSANYTLAKSLAKSEDCTISTAVNKLIRRAVEPKAPSSKVRWKNGLPVSHGSVVVTSEMVRRLDEELS